MSYAARLEAVLRTLREAYEREAWVPHRHRDAAAAVARATAARPPELATLPSPASQRRAVVRGD